jgi:hypothetical protein
LPADLSQLFFFFNSISFHRNFRVNNSTPHLYFVPPLFFSSHLHWGFRFEILTTISQVKIRIGYSTFFFSKIFWVFFYFVGLVLFRGERVEKEMKRGGESRL